MNPKPIICFQFVPVGPAEDELDSNSKGKPKTIFHFIDRDCQSIVIPDPGCYLLAAMLN